MKKIGLLGGMSWESTVTYYQLINQGIKREMGGLHSAEIVMRSVDFQPIETCQMAGDWDKTASILSAAACDIEKAGADVLLICTNTMHKVADQILESVNIPLLHIADATADHLKKQGIGRVGLLGTAFTMEQAFYKDRLINKHGINVLVPNEEDRKLVHNIIYQELCLGTITESSKQEYLRIVQELAKEGAEGVILGCTEIGLLIQQQDTEVTLFDTVAIHADAAVQFSVN